MAAQIIETRTIKCPVCGKGKLLDASKCVAPSSIRTHPPPLHHMAEYFIKCPKCKSQIGISLKHENRIIT